MIIFTTRTTNSEVAELLSAPCPDCPKFSIYPKGCDMSDLSPEEKGRVACHSLSAGLSGIRDILSKALDSQAGTNSDKFFVGMHHLFSVLWSSPVSALLQSRIGKGTLREDLDAISSDGDDKVFAHEDTPLLAQAVIDNASDVDIWSATTTFVQTIASQHPPAHLLASQRAPPASPSPSSPRTPSMSPAPEIEGTPIRRSSSSHLPYDGDAKEVEGELYEEIRHDTKQADGFRDKYFEGKAWHDGAKRAWESAKRLHTDGRWSTLNDPPTQTEMYKFLFDLQADFLAHSQEVRGVYRKGCLKDMYGRSTKNKPDAFTFNPAMIVSELPHYWNEIAVVGELKESDYKGNNEFLQTSRYARAVFAHQPTRNFIHAFTIVGTKMLTYIFDRSGVYTADKFDIHEDPERFFQIFCAYVMMNDGELGFNTVVSTAQGKLFMQIQDRTDRILTLDLHHPPISFQRAIVCRGTACYYARVSGAGINDVNNSDYVVKFSWSSETRTSEIDLLEEALSRGVKGVPEIIASRVITNTRELRDGLHFRDSPMIDEGEQQGGLRKSSKRRKLDNQQTVDPISSDYPNIPFKNRILRVLVISPAGRAIDDFKSFSELFSGLRDAIRGHQSLYEVGRILHRDVSEDNIILTSPQGPDVLKGLLIDLDMAQRKNTRPSRDSERTGGVEFMAIEALDGKPQTYRHDLESFLYVLLWLCVRRGWKIRRAVKKEIETSMLHRWVDSTDPNPAAIKIGHMHPSQFPKILEEFPPGYECVKSLCMQLRDILFKTKFGDLFMGTPTAPRSVYDPIIRAFDEALETVDPEHNVAPTTQPTRGRGRRSGGRARGGRGGSTSGGQRRL